MTTSDLPRIAALVPMRHHSERVPGKNYRDFAGVPLYHHIVRALLACPQLGEIVIDTDSPTIMEDAARHFPQVRLLERPEHLRAGDTPMNDVLLHATSQVEADFYLQTHSTNPLLRPQTIQRAVDAFLRLYPVYDTLFGVTRWQTRLWDGLARPINHNAAILLHATSQVEADFYLQTHSTNPLLRPQTIQRAVDAFLRLYPVYDTLFGVTRWQTRLWDGLARPINHNAAILLRTQDLPPVYEENSNLYIFSRETLLRRHNRVGERPYLFEIDRLEAVDIDDESAFVIAELLYQRFHSA